MTDINNAAQVEDVEFKDLDLYDEPKEKKEQAAPEAPVAYRILHVQVAGNPTTEELNNVAQSFQQTLSSTTSQAITTTENVTAFSIYEQGQAPFTGVLVRGAINLEDIARTAYEAANFEKKFADLDVEGKQGLFTTVNGILRGTPLPEGSKHDAVFFAVVNSLKLNLPVASSANLKPVQAWTGSSNLDNPAAWTIADFMTVKKTNIFRYEDKPEQYLCAVSDVYTNYQGPSAVFTIDVVEVEVSGVVAIDPETPSKGFTLNWQVKNTAVAADTKVQDDGDLTTEQLDAIRKQAEAEGVSQEGSNDIEPFNEDAEDEAEPIDLHDDNIGMPVEDGEEDKEWLTKADTAREEGFANQDEVNDLVKQHTEDGNEEHHS